METLIASGSPRARGGVGSGFAFERFQCGRTFRRVPDLLRHQRNYRSEQPFGCEVCGQAFSLRGHLGPPAGSAWSTSLTRVATAGRPPCAARLCGPEGFSTHRSEPLREGRPPSGLPDEASGDPQARGSGGVRGVPLAMFTSGRLGGRGDLFVPDSRRLCLPSLEVKTCGVGFCRAPARTWRLGHWAGHLSPLLVGTLFQVIQRLGGRF